MFATRFVLSVFSVGSMILGASMVSGQAYPYKPIRILSNEPGAGNDFVARILAQIISVPLGQPVIVENRPSLFSIETAAKAQPDGYSLLLTANSMWLLQFMRDGVSWDPVRDFLPVTMTMKSPLVLVVQPALPVQSVKELIALAKAKPGELNFSAGTRGSAVHLAPELFKAMSGANIVGIQYKGGAASIAAVMSGEVQMTFSTAAGVAPFLKSGKVRGLAVTSAQPSPLVPGLPSVATSGLPGYELVNYSGMFVPAKTAGEVIRRLNQEVVRALNQADVREKLTSTGAEIVGNSPEQAAAIIRSEMTRMSKVIKDAGIRAE